MKSFATWLRVAFAILLLACTVSVALGDIPSNTTGSALASPLTNSLAVLSSSNEALTSSLSHSQIMVFANNGTFDMVKTNMEKIDWALRFRDWETKSLQSDSTESLSKRYGKQMLGESEWTCDANNGCASKPDPRRILEFVNASLPDLAREEKVEEAVARYWAAMTFWTVFRSASNTINSLKGAHLHMSTSLDSIILDFTKQDDSRGQLMCDIKTFFINQIWSKSLLGLNAWVEKYKPKFHPYWSKAQGSMLLDLAKDIIMFGVNTKYGYKYGTEHPGKDVTDSPDFLRLTSEGYTKDLMCGHIDGISGTGGDNMYRISDAGYHMREIMNAYVRTLSKVYRILNGLDSDPAFVQRMSDWMLDSHLGELVRVVDHFNMAQQSEHLSKIIEGYFISASWAANKCFMKCQADMNPFDVQRRCHEEKFAKERYCPAEEPTTLCQASCYTMMDAKNHEKPLFGLDKLQKHGFSMEEVKKESWQQYRESANSQRKPELDIVAGGGFRLNSGRSSLILSVSRSKTNIIADDLVKSKNFPCYSGDWRGLETAGFMDRLGMGPGSPDWGEASQGNPRAWEVFQSQCPEETRKMAPLTRYMNMMCGLHLVWPGKSAKEGLVKNQILKPDLDLKNDELCKSLRTRTEGVDERTANVLFCTQQWPETREIFARERMSVFTDYNAPRHRKSGLYFMFNTKINCKSYLRGLPKAQNAEKYLGKGWSATHDTSKINQMIGPTADFTGTVYEDVADVAEVAE